MIQTPDILGNTPLHYWIFNSHQDPQFLRAGEILLKNGADPNCKNLEGKSVALFYFSKNVSYDSTLLNMLHKFGGNFFTSQFPVKVHQKNIINIFRHFLEGTPTTILYW